MGHASVKMVASARILVSPLSATAQHSTLEHSVNNVNTIVSNIYSVFYRLNIFTQIKQHQTAETPKAADT